MRLKVGALAVQVRRTGEVWRLGLAPMPDRLEKIHPPYEGETAQQQK